MPIAFIVNRDKLPASFDDTSCGEFHNPTSVVLALDSDLKSHSVEEQIDCLEDHIVNVLGYAKVYCRSLPSDL